MTIFHKNLVSGQEILSTALKQKKAVGAFNFSNMEILQAIVESANEENSSCIIQVSESAIKYMGLSYLINMAHAAADTSSVPLCLHLDHGKDFDICAKCIDAGFSSVMIDKSSLPFEENIQYTRQVVEYAHDKGVSVEAELGTLAGIEDEINIDSNNVYLTDPEEAANFVSKTGVDSLAVAIGTSHGPNKGLHGNPKLDIARLAAIKNMLGDDFPIVLHGASSVYPDVVTQCNSLGANIKGAFGISDADIREAIVNGVVKINVDTDIRLSFLAGVRESLNMYPNEIDPRKYLKNAKEHAKKTIRRKIRSFIIDN